MTKPREKKSKYPLINKMKELLKTKERHTGAGPQRDAKLLEAEQKALGMRDKMRNK